MQLKRKIKQNKCCLEVTFKMKVFGVALNGSAGVRKMTRTLQTSFLLHEQKRTHRHCSSLRGFHVLSMQESVDLDSIVESFEHKPTSRPIVNEPPFST